MSKGLYRVSVMAEYHWEKLTPVYVVSDSKKEAADYVAQHLKKGTVGKVCFLADQLGPHLYHKAKGES